MSRQPENAKPISAGLKLDQSAACDGCGQFGAFHIDDRTLCPECYQQSGACCSGRDEEDIS